MDGNRVGPRALVAAALAAALVAVAAAPAVAARPVLPDSVFSDHFVVHYNSADPTTPTTTARQLSADAEAGEAISVGQFQYPLPVSDGSVGGGDGLTDIYTGPDPGGCGGCNGFTAADSGAARTSAWTYINPAVALNKSTVAHEYFHVIQYGIYAPQLSEPLITEASASWIGALAAGTDGGHPPFWMRGSPSDDARGSSLDCVPGCPTSEDIYGQWPLYQSFRERYSDGARIVEYVFTESRNVGVGARQLRSLDEVLSTVPSSVGNETFEYARRIAAADWGYERLAGRYPVFTQSAVLGVNANASSTMTSTLDHLATRYFDLRSNACSGGTPCDATLHLDWTASPNVRGSVAQRAAGRGTRVDVTGTHADLGFNAGAEYVVGLTNVNESSNGVPVTLSASATRNPAPNPGGSSGTTSTPAPSTTAPSTTAPSTTAPVQPPVVTPVPAFDVLARAKVAKGRTSRKLSLRLNSSSAGFVVVTLARGGAKLVAHTAARATTFSRTVAVKQGANTVRVVISRNLPKGSYTIGLTPQSASGQSGTPISAGKVSVPKAPKAKKRSKRKAPLRVY